MRSALENTDECGLLKLAQQTPRFTLIVDNTLQRPLTDYEVVMATLAYANGATIYFKGTTRGRRISTTPEVRREIKNHQEALDAEQRLATQRSLALGITDPEAAIAQMFPNNADTFITSPKISRVTRLVPGGLSVSYFEEFLGDEDFLLLGCCLLLDVSREFQKRLCRCALPSCSLFFFEIRGSGLPQRKYCCKDHRDEAHTRGAAARSARRRAGVRVRTASKPK
jgi:hypothetical protein